MPRNLSTRWMTREQKMKPETPGDTLRDVEAEAFGDTPADRPQAIKLGKTLTDVNCASLLQTLAAMLIKVEAKTVAKTL